MGGVSMKNDKLMLSGHSKGFSSLAAEDCEGMRISQCPTEECDTYCLPSNSLDMFAHTNTHRQTASKQFFKMLHGGT